MQRTTRRRLIRHVASSATALLLLVRTAAADSVADQVIAETPAPIRLPPVRTPPPPARNTLVQGCWGAADKGDGADLKLAFLGDGSLVQYDEKQQDKLRRTFGAWEMQQGSTFLVVYWPDGSVSRYNVKRIGPILHFSGLFGVRNFTLHELENRNCWVPAE